MPLHLAGHHPAVRRLHVRLRADGAWLVPNPRLPVQQGSLDGHRRDPGGDLEGAWARPARHANSRSPSANSCSAVISTATGCRAMPDICADRLAQLQSRALQALASTARWCSSAMPPIRPISPSAPAPSSPWKTPYRCAATSPADAGGAARSGARAPTTRSATWRCSNCRAPRATAWNGSRTSRAMRTSLRSSSPTVCSPAASASATKI